MCNKYALGLQEELIIGSFLVVPIGAVWMFLLVFLQPKRNTRWYIKFIYFQFILIAVVAPITGSVGLFRSGKLWIAVVNSIKVPLYFLALWQALKICNAAAKLPPTQLSAFLCEIVLLIGAGVMGPMIFFAFEAVSCFVSNGSMTADQCTNTVEASSYLCFYLGIITTISILNKAMPESVQLEVSWEYSKILSLNLFWWQKLQGLLIVIGVLSSFNLLSVLGVEGAENLQVTVVAVSGFLAVGGAGIIASINIYKTYVRQASEGIEREEGWEVKTFKSLRTISTTEMVDGMVLTSVL